jgi:hypothetical protein
LLVGGFENGRDRDVTPSRGSGDQPERRLFYPALEKGGLSGSAL